MNDIKTTAEAIEAAALPEAYAVHAGKDGKAVKNHQAAPKGAMAKPLAKKSPAEWAYERIVMYIQKFEEDLDSEHEVGMGFAGSEAGTLKIQGMGYFDPDIITFYGEDPEGNKMQLVQHVSQLSVMLVSEPKSDPEQEPNRIGFQLAEDLDAAEGMA